MIGNAAAGAPPMPDATLEFLRHRATQLGTREFLAESIETIFAGKIAVVSSFGVEAAALLHVVAAIDRAVPVIFVDTGKLFAETLAYRDRLVAALGLTDVRSVQPAPMALRQRDAAGDLWQRDPDLCCDLRKVQPLADALLGFEAWISGRKRFQVGDRTTLPAVERSGGRIKLNPFFDWSAADIRGYFARHRLPPHPLGAEGYTSVGCTHCTSPTRPGEGTRAGRWRGRGKTECGIHFEAGRISRRNTDAANGDDGNG